ncbi:hypothetical protein PISL3812_08072 [Talaromyces islandicus]|uniref:Carboxylic ester hydrolase n=1 Tax=Talaromyces islandicus TaxID=28573 RepID=A0A0U1M649_TALIS|nr:hypothetical protein PISL3812_08072 [Talaromyces islandicus]
MHSAILFIFFLRVTFAVAQTAADLCTRLPLPQFEEFKVLSGEGVVISQLGSVSFCNFTAVITHPEAEDTVYITVGLPLSGWNGRFVANGGGGFSEDGDVSVPNILSSVSQGYATATTDGGLTLNHTIDAGTGAWGITSEGNINTGLLKNFAYRSIHDMTVLSKAAIKSFYGSEARYSYYSGCSTGGRQGYFAAQLYPGDFNGVLADAPALYTPQLASALFWPYTVMQNEIVPPQCIFDAFQNASIEYCDMLDGVKDGIISEPWNCDYDPRTLLGSTVLCLDPISVIKITQQHVDVYSKTIRGPETLSNDPMWYGLAPGSPTGLVANTTTIEGKEVATPMSMAASWIKYFVTLDPEYNLENATFSEYESLYNTALRLYSGVLGNNDPDLSAFEQHGGKLLTWHGLADPLIDYQSTIHYRQVIDKKMGGTHRVNKFYRLFLAPGASHCISASGPAPVDALGSLVSWVESGIEPNHLNASLGSLGEISWDLCPYPQILEYNGIGPTNIASSYTCGRGPESWYV